MMKTVTAISMQVLTQIIRTYLLLAIAATGLFVLSAPVHAGFIHGYVYTRSVVINDNNNLTWGEFDPASGSYIRDIGEATGVDYDPKLWRTMSGNEYRGYVKQKTTLHEAQSDLVLMSRTDYEGADLLLADGSAMTKPGLGRTTAYVSILPQSRRLIDDPASLILAEYPVNPDAALADDILSMLHKFSGDKLGIIKNETSNRIGFKTAFAVDGAGNAVPIGEEENLAGGSDYEAAGPIANALLEEAIFATKGVSGENGKFTMRWHSIPCPMYGYSLSNRLTMKLRYQRFNPKAKGYPGWTFDSYPLGEVCVPYNFVVPFIGPVALSWENHTFPKTGIHFDIDLTILSGTAQLSAQVGTSGNRVGLSSSKVPVGGSTQYFADSPNNDKITVGGYDFDRDGIQDTTLPGHLEPDPLDPTKQLFVVGVPEELQGVWLSSGGVTPQTGQPDLTRVLDSASFANGSHQGLLSQISAEDLRNTDLYIVRVSDGKLISERIGLNEYEASHLLSNVSDFGEDSSNNQFFYTLQMQGSRGDHRFISGLRDYNYREFEDWQAASGINPELHQRAADQLQPGDLIRIYAINRATGYIGHVNSIMQPGNIENGDLSFHIDPIIMGPPNLRVRAERGYKIQSGVTKSDETITQVIGFEGASLTSDKTVTISTEWLDHNGHPMPESLAGAGYTGRIAILSGDKTLSSSNDGVFPFSIEPGQHLQVLQLPNALTGSEHFYIHVSGEPKSGNPIFAGNPSSTRSREADFSSSGQNPGILTKRPDNYVPFLVRVFDEMASEFQTQAYRTLKESNPGLYTEAPDPVYRWVYRPEMQFSSYDLTVSEINKTRDTNANGATDPGETINILNDETTLITSDSVVDILYGLSTTDLLPLDYFNAGESKELIFVIGEQEVVATLGEGQRIIFDDLSHLDLLSPDDLLTIRLYANNDLGNILWQFALLNFAVYPDNEIEISADDHSAYIAAVLNHPDGSEIDWTITEGSGSLSESKTLSVDNLSAVQLNTSTTPGDTYKVQGVLSSVTDAGVTRTTNGRSSTQVLKVVAGSPDAITIEKSKDIYRSDYTDTVTLTSTIRDQFGNLVEDGTQVSWFINDSTSQFVTTETVTTAGKVTAVLKAPRLPIDQQIIVKAGDIEQFTIMPVERVAGSLVSSASTLNLSTSETAQITATVNVADGTPVHWTTSNGEVQGNGVVTNGTVTAELSTVGGIRGPVAVTATIGDRLLYWEGNYTSNSLLTATVAHQVIVSGAEQDGVETITWADGTLRNIRYWASTPVEISGPANTDLQVAVIGQQIIDAFTFDTISSDVVTGLISGHSMSVTGATLDTIDKHYGAGSLLFDGAGNGQITHHSDFDLNAEFSSSLWIKPSVISSATLLAKGDACSLNLLPDGRVEAVITTSTDNVVTTYNVISEIAVNADVWSHIGVDYGASGLRISVNSSAKTNGSATGTIKNNTNQIIVAQDFSGRFDDLKFSASSIGSSIQFSGVDAAGRLQLNSAGQASFNVSNTGAIAGGVSRRVPISVRATSPITRNDGFSFIKNAYADDINEAVTYVEVADHNAWVYTYDAVTSFFGADPETGVGIASNVAGGMLIVGDVGALAKNLWRTSSWAEKEPNAVESIFSGIGLATEFAVGAGEVADAPVSVVKAIAATIGDTPLTRVLGNRVKDIITSDVDVSAAEKLFLEAISKGDTVLLDTFNELVKSPELYETAIRLADNLGDDFFAVAKQLATDTTIGVGKEGVEAVVKTLSTVSDDVLASIKSSSVPLSESMAGLAKAGAKVPPELLTKILGNDNIYSATYKQADLLSDLSKLSDVKGFDLLVDTLATGNKSGVLKNFPQGLGFRYEVEAAVSLKKLGFEVTELTRKVAVKELDEFGEVVTKRTDIDVVVKAFTNGPDILVQVKRSKAALKSLTKVQEWVGKSLKHLGTTDKSSLRYVLPDGVVIPKNIAKYFSDNGIKVIRIPHL